jgi:membrane protease YdiL (CAAX protease family)
MASAVVQRLQSVPWRIRDALVAFLLPWVVLPLGIVAVLQLLAPSLPSIQNYLHALSQNQPQASFSLVLVTAVSAVLTINYYLRKYHVGPKDLGLRPFSLWRAAVYLVIVLVAFGFLVEGAYLVAKAVDPSFNASQAQTNQFIGSSHFSVLSLFAVVIIPPFIEESVFRGFMFPAITKRYGVVIGAIATSVLFGFAHLQGNISVYTFVLSLLLCGLYLRTNSIIPGMAVHMLNNYVAYLATLHK